MERVEEVNTSPQFIVKITEVVVFGSYLGEKEMLGDLDIAVKYERKQEYKSNTEFSDAMSTHARASGRRFGSFIDILMWPTMQVLKHLKNRLRVISIHEMDEIEQMMSADRNFRFEVLLGDREEIVRRAEKALA
jgi:predicted nucleotidyltransferase